MDKGSDTEFLSSILVYSSHLMHQGSQKSKGLHIINHLKTSHSYTNCWDFPPHQFWMSLKRGRKRHIWKRWTDPMEGLRSCVECVAYIQGPLLLAGSWPRAISVKSVDALQLGLNQMCFMCWCSWETKKWKGVDVSLKSPVNCWWMDHARVGIWSTVFTLYVSKAASKHHQEVKFSLFFHVAQKSLRVSVFSLFLSPSRFQRCIHYLTHVFDRTTTGLL